MGRDTIHLENAVSTIFPEYLLEFASEYGTQEGLHLEFPGPQEAIMEFPKGKVGVYTRRKQIRRKRANDEAGMNAPPKVLRKDYVYNPTHNTHRGISLAGMWFDMGSSFATPSVQGTPPAAKSVRDPDPLSYARPQPSSEQDITQSSKGAATEIPTEDADTTVANVQLSGVTNDCRLDTPEAYQNMVDHIMPSGYFSELRHLPNTEFLSQYNLARQVSMGSQLRLRYEQEVRLLKKARSKIARRDQRIQVREEEIKKLDKEIQSLRSVEAEVQDIRNQTKNLKTMLEAEADMKNATEAKNAELAKELDSLCKEKIKASLEEFKKYEDTKVEKRCAEIDTRLDALSIDFDEELYPYMLTVIAGLRHDFADVVSAGIANGFCKGVKHGVEHGEVKLNLADIKAYDPKAEGKFIMAMQALKELKYLLIDELENLKDAPMDIIMASLYLKSDTGEDAPQWIRDLRPSVSQLKIPVYPERRKKCQIVCRTHGVGFAYHARSDEVLVSALTVIPQGLQILLEDAAIQTELPEDKASPRLIRSKSLPAMYNLNWS
ncbi:hypothetical protein Tco_1002064 [Tanacetum coccineum]|uniref:Transposase (Putative), gypsy type n=1 Tax=Tanacetum coccineum TaxID=301880 RepID=A0ABQ5F5B0_9ASTR